MNDYEKLVDITANKLSCSEDFLKQTLHIKDLALSGNFDNIDAEFDKRQDIIDNVTLLDEQFISLFETLKKTADFEKNILNYPKLSEYINKIKNIFEESRNIDTEIRPLIQKESDIVRAEIKERKTKAKVNDKYGSDIMEKSTKENFGIFLDSMQ